MRPLAGTAVRATTLPSTRVTTVALGVGRSVTLTTAVRRARADALTARRGLVIRTVVAALRTCTDVAGELPPWTEPPVGTNSATTAYVPTASGGAACTTRTRPRRPAPAGRAPCCRTGRSPCPGAPRRRPSPRWRAAGPACGSRSPGPRCGRRRATARPGRPPGWWRRGGRGRRRVRGGGRVAGRRRLRRRGLRARHRGLGELGATDVAARGARAGRARRRVGGDQLGAGPVLGDREGVDHLAGDVPALHVQLARRHVDELVELGVGERPAQVRAVRGPVVGIGGV